MWDVSNVDPELPPDATRSTYQESRASQGPRPVPPWVVTSSAALDYERGVVKTGKEADVHLVERVDPDTGQSCLLAAKRYRSLQHRMFHRDAGYLEGRRVRRSREMRAMATRTAFGRELIAGQWASAEFGMLARMWSAGVAVPYPVQLGATDLLIEFIGDPDGTAAPRLAEVRPDDAHLDDLWMQCRATLTALAAGGFAHGDLSAYNVLVHDGRLVLIDLPHPNTRQSRAAFVPSGQLPVDGGPVVVAEPPDGVVAVVAFEAPLQPSTAFPDDPNVWSSVLVELDPAGLQGALGCGRRRSRKPSRWQCIPPGLMEGLDCRHSNPAR